MRILVLTHLRWGIEPLNYNSPNKHYIGLDHQYGNVCIGFTKSHIFHLRFYELDFVRENYGWEKSEALQNLVWNRRFKCLWEREVKLCKNREQVGILLNSTTSETQYYQEKSKAQQVALLKIKQAKHS